MTPDGLMMMRYVLDDETDDEEAEEEDDFEDDEDDDSDEDGEPDDVETWQVAPASGSFR